MPDLTPHPPSPVPTAARAPDAADFTEAAYEHILDLARERYRFVDHGESGGEPCVVWRHDIDYSPHRALALARLEAARGLSCVYHVLLSGRYYSVLEPGVGAILRQIRALGHSFGLHFDMDVFGTGEASYAQLEERIALERRLLEHVLDASIGSLSFHNYVLNRQRLVESRWVGGLLNICNPDVAAGFKYVSDSNGLWRYERLEDVLIAASHPRLHVLTHPEWWTPQATMPIERLRRAIDGRAGAGFRFYIDTMRRDGRLASVGPLIGLGDADDEQSDTEY